MRASAIDQLTAKARIALEKAIMAEQSDQEEEKLAFLKEAKMHYGILIGDKNLPEPERRAAYYTLTCIFLALNEFEQAQTMFKFLNGDFNIDISYLPSEFKPFSIIQIVGSNFQETKELHLADCNIKGKAVVNSLAEAIKNCEQIDCIDIQSNPLSKEEVHLFLDAIAQNKNKRIGHINLSYLPIDQAAVQKIIALIENSISLEIDLIGCNLTEESLIINAVEKALHQHIIVRLTSDKITQQDKIIEIHSKKAQRDDELIKVRSQLSTFLDEMSNLYDKWIIHAPNNLPKPVTINFNEISITKNNMENYLFQFQFQGENSIVICAEDSDVIIDKDIFADSLFIQCKSLTICKDVTISIPHVNVFAKNTIKIEGEIYSYHKYLDAKDIILAENAVMAADVNTGRTLCQADVFTCNGIIIGQHVAIHATKNSFGPQGKINATETFISSRAVSYEIEHFIECKGVIWSKILYIQNDGNIIFHPGSEIESDDFHIRSDKSASHENLNIIAKFENKLAQKKSANGQTKFICAPKKQKKNNHSFKNSGKIKAKQLSIEGKSVKLSGEILPDQSHPLDIKVKANALTLDGKIQTETYYFNVDQLFVTSRTALTRLANKDEMVTSSLQNVIDCHQRFYTNENSVIESLHQLKINTKTFTHYGIIHSYQHCHLIINGCGEVFKEGRIISKDKANILIEGDRLWNSGEIHAAAQLNLAFDKFIILGVCDLDPVSRIINKKSFGALSGQSITTTSAFFVNLIGTINASNKNEINSFIEFNLGAVTGKNIQHSNIIGLDLGVNVTAIKAMQDVIYHIRQLGQSSINKDKALKSIAIEYWEKVSSESLAASAVSMALKMAAIAAKLLLLLAPQVGIPVNTVLSTINILLQLASSGFQIKNELSKLMIKHQQGNLHPRDIYPMILAVKNAAVAGSSAAMVGFGLPDTIKHMPDQIKDTHVHTHIKDMASSLFPAIAGHFAGYTTKQSIISIESGLTITGVNHPTAGLQLDALSSKITGAEVDHAIVKIAQDSLELAASSEEEATIIKHHDLKIVGEEKIIADNTSLEGTSYHYQLNINTTKLTQTGDTRAQKAMIHTEQTTLNGKVAINSGALQTTTLEETDSANVKLKNMQIQAETVHLAAHNPTKLEHDLIIAHDITQAEGSKLETNDVSMIAYKVNFSDDIKTFNKLYVEAKEKITLSKNTTVTGEETDIKSPVIANDGNIKTKKIDLDSHFTNQEVNDLVSKPSHYQATESFTIQTDEAVSLNQEIKNEAKAVTVIAKSVENNVAQHINDLTLQSTEGDVVNNKVIDGNHFTAESAHKAIINASIKTNEKAVVVAEDDVIVNDKVIEKIVKEEMPSEYRKYKTYFNFDSKYGKRKDRYVTERTINSTEISGKEVALVSHGGHVTLNGTQIKASDHYMLSGGVTLNNFTTTTTSSHPTNIYDYFHPKTTTITQQTIIQGHEGYITGDFLTNNGQQVFANKLLIDVKGDVINQQQGILRATDFLGINAKNVNNLCEETLTHGKYSDYKTYYASTIAGGDGKNTNGVGLMIDASGKVLNDASRIESNGTNFISGKQGIKNRARSETYLAYEKNKSSWLGMKHEKEKRWDTSVYRSSIISYDGKNILVSEEGGIKSDATYLLGAKGSYFGAKDKIEFYDRVASSYTEKHSSTLGIFYTDKERYDEYSVPTILNVPPEGVTIVSRDSDVMMRGTVVAGPGLLSIAGKNFYASVSTLNHDEKTTSFGFGASIFGQEFLHSNTPTQETQAFFNADPTISHFNRLAQSNGVLETGLNSWSTGIHLLNTSNVIANGLRQDQLPAELLKHELGDTSPHVTVTFKKYQEESHWQTLGEGDISVGQLQIDVGDGDVVFQGLPVYVENDALIKAGHFKQNGIELRSSYQFKEEDFTVGIGVSGIDEVGMGFKGGTNNASTYANQQFYVGNTFNIIANEWTMDAANANVGQIQGHVNQANFISRTDKQQNSNYDFSFNTSGNVSASEIKSKRAMIRQAAGLHVRSGINDQNPNDFSIKHLYMEGGKITSNGVNHLVTETITVKSVDEYSQAKGFNISGNWHDFIPQQKTNSHLSMNDNFAKQINTINVGVNKEDFQAKQQAVIYGDKGTALTANQINGGIHTTSADGTDISKNESHHYIMEMPTFDKAALEQIDANFVWAAQAAGVSSPAVTAAEQIIGYQNLQTPEEMQSYLDNIHTTFQLSQAVYDNDVNMIDGFDAIDDVYEQNGIKVVVYVNDETKEAIIAFRGTANLTNVYTDDLDIAEGNIPRNYDKNLQEYLSRYVGDYQDNGYSIVFTGHSLGATFASLASSDYDCPAYVYDNPGVSNSQGKYDFSQVISFQSQPNVINHAPSFFGRDQGHVIQLQATAETLITIAASKLLGASGTFISTLHTHQISEMDSQIDAYIKHQQRKISNESVKVYDINTNNRHLFFSHKTSVANVKNDGIKLKI